MKTIVDKCIRVGLSTCGKLIDENLFREYHLAGISDMEISTAHDKYARLDYQKLLEWSKQYEVNLWSYHLPFIPFEEIDISRKSLQRQSLEYLSELIKKATDIGIDKFVIHPSGEPIEECGRGERIACAKDSLAELADIADKYQAVVAVENLPRTCLGRNSSEILELISSHPKLRVCFDTNHLLREEIPLFVQNVGEKIVTLHVSDYDFVDERHWLPGEGDINWTEVLTALQEVGYTGSWLYEVGYSPTVTISRRKLCAKDFVDNAKAIFDGEKPKVIGVRRV